MLKIPKTILNHPSVSYVVDGEEEGSDYKWWVFLKNGESFTGGTWAGCSGGAGFDSVVEFKQSMGII